METFRLLYISVAPGIAIAVYIYYADKWEPEPKSLVVTSFILGGLACFPASYFESAFQSVFGLEGIWAAHAKFSFWQNAFFAFFGVALVEEGCKFFFLKAVVYDRREFNEPFDGIVYGGMVGCGFATVENLFYVFQHGYDVGILRMYTAVPAHAFGGIILGYFMGKAKFSDTPWKHLMTGLILVIALHGAYDTAVFSNIEWSIYPAFGVVVLGIYLGLKAKKDFEKHSRLLESSSREFYVIRNGEKQGPLTLKVIRDSLSDGKLLLEDVLVEKESGERKSIREIMVAKIGSESGRLSQTPPRGQPVKLTLLFYSLTFGLYLFFWFYRNYRDFRNYKNLDVNPELRALWLFVFAVMPYFLYNAVLQAIKNPAADPLAFVPFNIFIAGIQAVFIYFQLRMIKGYLVVSLDKSFSVIVIVILFFVLSGVRKILTFDIGGYWMLEIILVALQGGTLAMVQKDLNRYWARESAAEKSPLA